MMLNKMYKIRIIVYKLYYTIASFLLVIYCLYTHPVSPISIYRSIPVIEVIAQNRYIYRFHLFCGYG